MALSKSKKAEVFRKADAWARSEIKKWGFPSLNSHDVTNKKAQQIAKKLHADSFVISLGTRLMDVKLGEALRKGMLKKHVEMGASASKKFLDKFNMDAETSFKIMNCIEAHHEPLLWKCKEAEICANADCYRFIPLKNFLRAFLMYSKETDSFDDAFQHAIDKFNEKWNILSLDMCRKELAPHYDAVQGMISKVRESP